MIRHTILFKVKAGTPESVINKAITDFIALRHKLPGIMNIVGGKCSFHEATQASLANQFFTHAISIDFVNEAGLDTFFNDSLAYPAKENIVNITVGGYEGIIGFELTP